MSKKRFKTQVFIICDIIERKELVSWVGICGGSAEMLFINGEAYFA